MEKKGWKILGIIFIVLFAISALIIYTIDKQISNMEYKCQAGTERRCAEIGAPYNTCKAGEQVLCYDDRLQSATTCNLAENLRASCVPNDYKRFQVCDTGNYAVCVPNGKQYSYCGTGEISTCIKEGTSCNICDTGFQPSCLDKTKWGVWTGSYVYTCSVGQTANCK
jgi:hypothetical protein